MSASRGATLAAGLRRGLRTLAARKLAQENPGQTLQATALVHEAYVRLVDTDKAPHWNSRGHFFAAAAEAMRRILIERGPEQRRQKRERRVAPVVDLDDLDLFTSVTPDQLWLLTRRSTAWPGRTRQRRVWVKLRYYGGLSLEEATSRSRSRQRRPTGTGPTPAPGCSVHCLTAASEPQLYSRRVRPASSSGTPAVLCWAGFFCSREVAMAHDVDHARSIFLAAIKEVPGIASGRHSTLDGACGDDGALRGRATSHLLEAHEAAVEASISVRSPARPRLQVCDPSEGAGSVIGPYKLLEAIGEGGMGTVYMADGQERPVRRRSRFMKIIKPGMDSAGVAHCPVRGRAAGRWP